MAVLERLAIGAMASGAGLDMIVMRVESLADDDYYYYYDDYDDYHYHYRDSYRYRYHYQYEYQ